MRDVSLDIFGAIAADVGVRRYSQESDASFCRRAAYSASRFWISAFCLDDGAGGNRGIAKQAINYRLKRWIRSIESLSPGIEEWFEAEGGGYSTLYNRLLDIGDLQSSGFSRTITATSPHILNVSSGVGLITGFFDCSDRTLTICGKPRSEFVTSGIATLMRTDNVLEIKAERWWEDELLFRSWENSNRFEDIAFADAKSRRWNIRSPEVWAEKPVWVDGVTLAMAAPEKSSPRQYFIARREGNRIMLGRIDWNQACSFFFFLRQAAGNEVMTHYVVLDGAHVAMNLPIGFIPGRMNRLLDAVSWPVENVKDRFRRIARTEALPLIKAMLSAAHVGVEELEHV